LIRIPSTKEEEEVEFENWMVMGLISHGKNHIPILMHYVVINVIRQ